MNPFAASRMGRIEQSGIRRMLEKAMALERSGREIIHMEIGRTDFDTPVVVKEAPVQEVVLTGKEVDVTRLPILTYHEKDAGRYITAGFGIMRDPDSGVRNAGIYRLMVHSPDSFGIQLSETAHGHYIWQMYERQNRPTPMAVAIGHHPAFYIGCLSFTSLETDEFSIAGGIMGEPVELVRCRTLDLEAPAHAEIVLRARGDQDESDDAHPRPVDVNALMRVLQDRRIALLLQRCRDAGKTRGATSTTLPEGKAMAIHRVAEHCRAGAGPANRQAKPGRSAAAGAIGVSTTDTRLLSAILASPMIIPGDAPIP